MCFSVLAVEDQKFTHACTLACTLACLPMLVVGGGVEHLLDSCNCTYYFFRNRPYRFHMLKSLTVFSIPLPETLQRIADLNDEQGTRPSIVQEQRTSRSIQRATCCVHWETFKELSSFLYAGCVLQWFVTQHRKYAVTLLVTLSAVFFQKDDRVLL